MPRLLYTLLLYLAMPLVLLRLLWRARRAPAYARRWRERFGFVSPLSTMDSVSDPAIWLHAVSVGETLAAVPLIKALQRDYPDHRLIVTTTTPTGSEQVQKLFGDSVYHVYAPYDLPGALRRFLERLQPSALIIMETELWPNLIHRCKMRGMTVALVNARLSARSARGYGKVAGLTAGMLAELDLVAAQAQADGERFVDLGLARDKLLISGNIKFDLELDQAVSVKAAELKSQWRGDNQRPVVLAASTHQGEDEQVLTAFTQVLGVRPEVLLILVPRHPERFDNVATLCRERGFNTIRRSENAAVTGNTQVLLGDTMGELLAFCGAVDMAFIGGSLVPVGGHNLIEPAAWGVPVLTGPHLFNFAEVAAKLDDAGGMKVCADAGQLAQALLGLLNNRDKYTAMAEAARTVAETNRGTLTKLTGRLSLLLD